MDRALDSGSRGCGFDSRQARQMRDIRIYADGGSSGNPGRSAIGFCVFIDNKLWYLHAECIGDATNNVAEYMALLKALEFCATKSFKTIKLYSDSKLVVSQVKGDFRVMDAKLATLNAEVRTLMREFEDVSVEWIPREENEIANSLVKKILKGAMKR